MKSKAENTHYSFGCLLLLIPFLIIINIICFLMIKNDVEIIKSDFKKGIIHLDYIDCSSISGSDGNNELCDGYGKVNSIATKVNLGNENNLDFNIKTLSVFYRSDGKFTLLNKNKSDVLDKKKYLRKTIFTIILLILINVIWVILFKKMKRNLKL